MKREGHEEEGRKSRFGTRIPGLGRAIKYLLLEGSPRPEMSTQLGRVGRSWEKVAEYATALISFTCKSVLTHRSIWRAV